MLRSDMTNQVFTSAERPPSRGTGRMRATQRSRSPPAARVGPRRIRRFRLGPVVCGHAVRLVGGEGDQSIEWEYVMLRACRSRQFRVEDFSRGHGPDHADEVFFMQVFQPRERREGWPCDVVLCARLIFCQKHHESRRRSFLTIRHLEGGTCGKAGYLSASTARRRSRFYHNNEPSTGRRASANTNFIYRYAFCRRYSFAR